MLGSVIIINFQCAKFHCKWRSQWKDMGKKRSHKKCNRAKLLYIYICFRVWIDYVNIVSSFLTHETCYIISFYKCPLNLYFIKVCINTLNCIKSCDWDSQSRFRYWICCRDKRLWEVFTLLIVLAIESYKNLKVTKVEPQFNDRNKKKWMKGTLWQ